MSSRLNTPVPFMYLSSPRTFPCLPRWGYTDQVHPFLFDMKPNVNVDTKTSISQTAWNASIVFPPTKQTSIIIRRERAHMPRVVIPFQNNSHLATCPRSFCVPKKAEGEETWGSWRQLIHLCPSQGLPASLAALIAPCPSLPACNPDSTLFAQVGLTVHTHLMQETCWLDFYYVGVIFPLVLYEHRKQKLFDAI